MVFKSSRKKLFAIGCSYTEKWNEWQPWPEVLADKLDMECVNMGLCGAGNDEMVAKVLEIYLTKKHSEIGLVVVMWSEWQRLSFQRNDLNWDDWHHVHPHRASMTQYIREEERIDLFNIMNPCSATRDTIRNFVYADFFLKDIPYLFVQGCDGIFYYNVETGKTFKQDHTFSAIESAFIKSNLDFYKINDSREKTVDVMIKNPYMEYVEKNIGKKFIGWPVLREIGGYSMDDVLNKHDPTRLKLRISKSDSHPNEDGHKFMADLIYDEYRKIYL